ncbi:cell division protein FtsW [Pikeienuella piscinae]|uniref:Probable peptidoglycan glycosyltransferase FtsW n=1 Tax=Pikeienuella piscinae TaxID=2748098 RepID=A0A7M3T6M1_9RHOB|nr:putative peptidoglycan glycosyltransferase FtsW [Pikeienuella piscinae]QIE57652.1 cell division protein FtsW [Pikeienuella piscinae]
MTELTFRAPQGAFVDPSILGRWWRTIDKLTLLALILLVLVGLLISFAASVPLAEKNGLPQFYFVTRHAVFAMISVGLMLTLSVLTPDQVRRNGVRLFLFAFVAVALLPVFGTDFGKGAVRWYSFGLSVQPSEFLKPGLAVLTGWMMAASLRPMGPPGVSLSFLVTAAVIGALAIQPDFGQALLVIASWGAMFFVWGAPIWLMVMLVGLGVGLIWFAYANFEYVASRINDYWSEEIDPTSQIGYATNAILKGGFFGVGAGEGSVKWSLPDAHTDFVMAVAAEEYGLLFCLLVIGLYLLITLRALKRLMREREPFVRVAGSGLAVMIGLQAFINIGVTFTLLPAKGMTLPFISYGGSSMVASGVAMGLMLALTRDRPQDHVTDRLGGGR